MSEARGPQFDAEPVPAEADSHAARLLTMFERWDKDLTAHWSAWREDARQEYDFVAGHQWSPEERSDMQGDEGSGKIPVVFNLTAPTIDAVCGAEIQNRQQVQYFPREVGDTGVADALTQGAEYVTDECNGDQEDSEAFRDALICGVGCTETRPEVDGSETSIVKERIDPLQMRADPSSRKACFEDARYICRDIPMSQDEFDDFKDSIGRPDAEGNDGGLSAGKRLTVVNPRQRYTNGMLGTGDEDEVVVNEWQWWEREPVHITALPHPTEEGVTHLVPLSAEAHDQAQGIAKDAGLPPLKSQASTHKVYYRAFVGGGEVLLYEPLKENAFRYKFITGKRDRNKGTWFGLVRPMIDPQRFANKLYSEILHIIRTNANGGLLMEADAVDDIRAFEASYSSADQITTVKAGSMTGPNGSKIKDKIPPPIQPALFQMMEYARDMVRTVTGVNDEILGLVGREQAGVLEYQRKQAAYGILSPFFDAQRRYRRDQGKLLLIEMRLYLPPDKLTRIVDQGTQQYVRLAETMQAAEYDVIVDDAPAGPNQKAKIMQVLGPWLPPMVEAGFLGPDDVADAVVPYLDIPAAVSLKLATALKKTAALKAAPNPMAQAAAAAELDNKHADTEHKRAQGFKAITQAHAENVQLGKDFLMAEQQSEQAQQEPQTPGQAAPAPTGETLNTRVPS